MSGEQLAVFGAAAMSVMLVLGLLLLGTSPIWLLVFVPHFLAGFFVMSNVNGRRTRM
jgi:hypothetical protein